MDLSRVEIGTSVDLDLRELRRLAMQAGLSAPDDFYVPLALLEKKLHLDFDAQASDGTSLQLFTSDQNAEYAKSLITAFLLKSGCPGSVVRPVSHALVTITGPGSPETVQHENAWSVLQALIDPRALQVLEAVPDFPEILETFHKHYLALVRVRDTGTPTTTVKYRFIEDSGEWNPSLREKLGLRFPVMAVEGQIGYPKSDHKVIEAPAGLVLDEVLSVVEAPESATFAPLKLNEKIVSRERISPRQYVLHARSPMQTGVVNYLRMTPNLGEFHFPAILSMTFTFLLLAAGLALELLGEHLTNLRNVGSVVTILALVPSILNVYLALPGEHPVVARLFAWPRVLVFAASAGTVLVAGVVAVQPGRYCLVIAFAVALAYVSLVSLLIISTAVSVRNSRRRHSRA